MLHQVMADGSARCRWNGLALRGRWWSEPSGGLRVAATSRAAFRTVSWDAVIMECDGGYLVEGLLLETGSAVANTVVIRQRLAMADRGSPSDSDPDAEEDGDRRAEEAVAEYGEHGDLGPGCPYREGHPLRLAMPEFAVTIDPEPGAGPLVSLGAVLVFSSADQSVDVAALLESSHSLERLLAAEESLPAPQRVAVSIHTLGPVRPGWLAWSVEQEAPGGVTADGELVFCWRRGTAGSAVFPGDPAEPSWYDDGSWPRADLSEASMTLRVNEVTMTVEGTILATGADGRRRSARVSGQLRSAQVEALRRRLATLGALGRWVGTHGRVGDLVVDRVDQAGSPVRLPLDLGFLRLSPALDMVIGLLRPPVASAAQAEPAVSAESLTKRLVVLRRADPPPGAICGPADRGALRALAVDLVEAGRFALSSSLASHAIDLYQKVSENATTDIERCGELTSLLGLLDRQVRAAFTTRDYPSLIRHLKRAIEVHNSMGRVPPSLAWLASSCDQVTDLCGRTIQHLGTVQTQALAVFDRHRTSPGPPGERQAANGPLVPSEGLGAALAVLAEVGTSLRAGAHLAGETARTVTGPSLREAASVDVAETVSSLVTALASIVVNLRASAEHLLRLGAARFSARPDLVSDRNRVIAVLSTPQTSTQEDLTDAQRIREAIVASLAEESPDDLVDRLVFRTTFVGAELALSAALPISELASRMDGETIARAVSDSRDTIRPAAARLSGYVQRWRALLEQRWDDLRSLDRQRILAVDGAVGFYESMVTTLTDLGLADQALVASEQGRARAFADLLATRAGTGGTTASELSFATLSELLSAHNRSVVEYHLAPGRLTVWTVQVADGEPRIAVHHRTCDITGLESEVKNLHNLMEKTSPSRADRLGLIALLERLGSLLWEPVVSDWLPEDPDQPVTIVPHGILLKVPFPTLVVDGQPLGARWALEFLPALALLSELRPRLGRRGDLPLGLLALVNPTMPVPRPGRPPLGQLSQTEARFGEITKFYDSRVAVHTGGAATLDLVRRQGHQAKVLLLATHADASAPDPFIDHPDSSEVFVALAPTSTHDGLVGITDVLDLSLGADMVILSACRTGGGVLTSDGVIGLSRAILAAGPTKILMTLCEVLEDTSFDIVRSLHRYWLDERMAPSAALRRVYHERFTRCRRVPHQWGTFMLFGVND